MSPFEVETGGVDPVPVAVPGIRSGLRDGLPAGWSEAVRFCPSCGQAADERSLLCGYREADEQVLFWWCHACAFQGLLVPLDDMAVDIVEMEEERSEL